MKKFRMPTGLEYKIGTARLTTLAEQHGVKFNTLRWHLSVNHRISPRREAQRTAGLSVAEVAASLGTDLSTIYRYIDRGLLKARKVPALTASIFSIDAEDVSLFLTAVGGLLPLNPGPTRRAEYESARTDLRRRYIASQPLAAALIIPSQQLARMRRRCGFPDPTWSLGSIGTFYDRAAVLAWLERNPQYDRPGTRAALGRL